MLTVKVNALIPTDTTISYHQTLDTIQRHVVGPLGVTKFKSEGAFRFDKLHACFVPVFYAAEDITKCQQINDIFHLWNTQDVQAIKCNLQFYTKEEASIHIIPYHIVRHRRPTSALVGEELHAAIISVDVINTQSQRKVFYLLFRDQSKRHSCGIPLGETVATVNGLPICP